MTTTKTSRNQNSSKRGNLRQQAKKQQQKTLVRTQTQPQKTKKINKKLLIEDRETQEKRQRRTEKQIHYELISLRNEGAELEKKYNGGKDPKLLEQIKRRHQDVAARMVALRKELNELRKS
jgi:hypothetical protein